jgi:phenylacetate-CoA ligase
MSLFSTAARHTALPLLLRREKQDSALHHWRFLEKSQFWSRDRLREYQWERLKILLQHAYESSPYYATVFKERGLTPQSLKNFDDLTKLPVLTRNDLFDKGREILSTKYEVSTLQRVMTGGTTGQQAPLYRNQESFNIKLGLSWRHENYMGRKPCDRMALIWPAHIDVDNETAFRSMIKGRYILGEYLFHAGTSDPKVMEDFYREIMKYKPAFFKVFPAAFWGLTKYISDMGYRAPRVKGILSTGEPLYDRQRELFETYYGCPVYDMYGSREVGNTASECPAHEGLHVAMETSYVEFIESGKAVEFGKEGEILITDLTNFAFPMIRYQINDYGTPIEKECSCRRGLQLMSPGIGRLVDDFWGPDGIRHTGNVLGIHLTAEPAPEIGQMQVIQKTLTDFVVKITRKPEPSQEVLEFIPMRMKSIIGQGINIRIEIVDEIPKEKSGKTRFLKCEINRPLGAAGANGEIGP